MLLLKNLRTPAARRDWKPVEKALDAAEKALPDSPQVALLRAQMLLSQDRPEDAEKLLRKARDKDFSDPALWRALTALADQRGDWDQAEKILKEGDAVFGDTPERRTAKAEHYVARYGKEAADRLQKLAENTQGYSEDQLLELWGGLLRAALQMDDTRLINLYSQKIAEKKPDDVDIRYFLFERALRSADLPAIEKALKEIERVAGKGAYWLYGQAVVLYLSGKDEKDANARTAKFQQALALLNKAQERRGDWSRIPLMEGGIYDALGKPDLALDNYRKAFDMGERNPRGTKRLVQLLMQTHQYAEADQLLGQLEQEQPTLTSELNRAGAELDLQLGDYNRALDRARKGATADSKNYLDHLWMGQMLGVLGSQAKAAKQDKKSAELLAQAEKAFRRAVELEPTLPQPWVALVRFYSVNGEVDKAEKAVEQAKLKIPVKDAPLALAQCYQAMHKPEEAEKQYEAALQTAPQNIAVSKIVAGFYAQIGKLPSAEALLQKIIDGKVPGETADVMWARRLMAQILRTRNGYDNLQKARKLLEQNLADDPSSADDNRLLAELNSTDPDRSHREKAQGYIKTLEENKKATPEDLLRLAYMYDSSGDWIKAANLYRTLIADNPKEPRYLVAFIEGLLRHKETSSVPMYLDRLKELAPSGSSPSLCSPNCCAPTIIPIRRSL